MYLVLLFTPSYAVFEIFKYYFRVEACVQETPVDPGKKTSYSCVLLSFVVRKYTFLDRLCCARNVSVNGCHDEKKRVLKRRQLLSLVHTRALIIGPATVARKRGRYNCNMCANIRLKIKQTQICLATANRKRPKTKGVPREAKGAYLFRLKCGK